MNYTFQLTLSVTIYFDLISSPLSPSFPFTHTEKHKYATSAICLYKSIITNAIVTKITALIEPLRIKISMTAMGQLQRIANLSKF